MTGPNYVEIELDRPRRLRYRIMDLRDLCQAMGNTSLLDIMARLATLDMNAVILTLRYGLGHEDRGMTPAKATELVQGYVDRHGSLTGLLEAIRGGLEASGILRSQDGSGPPGEAPAPSP